MKEWLRELLDWLSDRLGPSKAELLRMEMQENLVDGILRDKRDWQVTIDRLCEETESVRLDTDIYRQALAKACAWTIEAGIRFPHVDRKKVAVPRRDGPYCAQPLIRDATAEDLQMLFLREAMKEAKRAKEGTNVI